MSYPLGHVKDICFGPDGRERRERLDAIAECPKCGAAVECWAETEEWRENVRGQMAHSAYGGAQGVCEACGILIADCLSDGFRCFDLRAK